MKPYSPERSRPLSGAEPIRTSEPLTASSLKDCDLSVVSDSQAEGLPLIKSSADFVHGFVPPDYLLDGMLQRGFFYSLTGKTGSGKTAVVLLIAASVALGWDIGTHEVTGGRVLYFAGENADDIRMRWIGMAENMHFDINTINVDFIPGTFKISAMADRIKREVQDRGDLAFVVVDTSAAYFEGDDENSNAQQSVHARRLRSLVSLQGRPCVIVNCHPPKNAPDENLQPRGGGAFIAEVDGNLTTHILNGVVILHWHGKFRGPDFAPITFQLRTINAARLRDTKGRPIPTVMAQYLSEAAQEEIAAVARSREDDLLRTIAANPNASLTDLARVLGWKLKNGEPHKVMVQRARDSLKKAKLLTVERGKA